MNQQPKRPRGRPPIDEKATQVITVRLTEQQAELWHMLGGPKWLREQLQHIARKHQP